MKGSSRGKKFSKLKNETFIEPDFNDLSVTSPSGESVSPLAKSPWSVHADGSALTVPEAEEKEYSPNVPMGSLVREEGHIYSLAASGDLLYTGSDSKNIRVWKNQKEFSGFKSNSGLVKAIVIAGDKIFTGHQDGKIRVWKVSSKEASIHRRVGTLPTFKDCLKKSMKPGSYVDATHRSRWSSLWIKHVDAISCLALSEDRTFLYSASWDRTFKVWRVSDSKCLESVNAHDDAVNAVVSGFEGMLFTGSADGSVKVWRREHQGKGTKHFFSQTLLKEDCAVTAISVDPLSMILYVGSSDGTVNFWERHKQFHHGGVLRGHKQAVLCLAIAGKLVLSGSADSSICVWRRSGNGSEHVCVSVLKAHTGPVKCLAAVREQESVSGERRWIVYSGSLDKSVKMWRVSEQAPPMMFQGDSSDGGQPTSLPAAPSFAQHGRISAKRK